MKAIRSKYFKVLNVLVLSIFLLLIKCLQAQESNLDLSFENKNSQDKSNWMVTNEPKFYFFADTVNVIDGKRSAVIADRSSVIYPVNDFIASMFQYIILPENIEEIELSVFSKTRQVREAWMKVYLINEHGSLINRDSVSLISNEWNEPHLKIRATQATSLYLEIFLHNKYDKNKNTKDTIPCLWVDNIQLKLDGKPISSYPEASYKPSPTELSEIVNHVKLDKGSWANIDSIKDFHNHRILAFGETVHTSNEVQHFFFNTTKELILRNNCRLILIEIPFDIGLRLNDFIKGNKQVNLDELLYSFRRNPKIFISFLNWLSDYNSQNTSIVNIVGINEVFEFNKGDRILYQLIENKSTSNRAFLAFRALLKDGEDRQALHLLNNFAETLMLELGTLKFSEIKRGLELRNKIINPGNDLPDTYRDFNLFQNAKLAIDNYLNKDEIVVIQSHIAHLNKKNVFYCRYDVPSLGYYMKQAYGKDYFVTAVTVGSGTIAYPELEKMKSNVGYLLKDNKPGSLEALCSLSPDSIFYKKNENIRSTKYIRCTGDRIPRDDFYPFIPEKIIDGIVFIRKSSHYGRPDDWPNSRREYIFKKYKDKK